MVKEELYEELLDIVCGEGIETWKAYNLTNKLCEHLDELNDFSQLNKKDYTYFKCDCDYEKWEEEQDPAHKKGFVRYINPAGEEGYMPSDEFIMNYLQKCFKI